MAFFGCQFAWAVQDGNVSPYLRELGMSRDTMNYAWLLGPVSGILLQPVVGVLSDHCSSSLGRRTPFIVGISMMLCVCLLLFCSAESFGYPLVMAFTTFCVLDFSTNALEGPLRAITADTLSQKEQLSSHSWFGIMNGSASTIAFGLGYMVNDISIIFSIAAAVMVLSVVMTTILVQEVPLNDSSSSSTPMTRVLAERMKEIAIGVMTMPLTVRRCWMIQFCSYFGHFANWVYLCEYFGTQIMGGHPQKLDAEKYDLYRTGVEYGNLCFMLISLVSIAFSFCISKLVELLGLKHLWMLCLWVYALVLSLSIFVSDLYLALFLFSLAGLPMAASFTIPWSVVGAYSKQYDRERACLWTVILNVAECGPELILALVSGFIVDLFRGRVAGVFVVSAAMNAVGVWLVAITDFKEYDGERPSEGDVHVDVDVEDEDEDDDHEMSELLGGGQQEEISIIAAGRARSGSDD